jgi:hypothetical protein
MNASSSIQSRVLLPNPGHAGELIKRRQIRFESRREIVPSFLALLRTRVAVVHELTQALGLLQEAGVLAWRVQLRRNCFDTLRDRGVAHLIIPVTLSGREKVPAQSRDPFGDLQRVQCLIGEGSDHGHTIRNGLLTVLGDRNDAGSLQHQLTNE